MNEGYAIVSGETLEALIGIVSECMTDGWQPLGGPFVVSKKLWAEKPKAARGELVAQAMVKPSENGKVAA